MSQQVLDQTVRDMMGFADDLDTAPAEEEKKTGKEPDAKKQAKEKKETPKKAKVSEKSEAPVKETKPAAPIAEEKEKAFIQRFIRRVRQRGFLYDERDLYNFHISAKSSRLVILAGRSGTGKSGLVRLYGEALGLTPSQVAFLPVRPSWMDDGDILGYLDRNRMLYFPSDTGLAELLVEASRHPEKM